MVDQAETLRRLMQGRKEDPKQPEVLTVTECGEPGGLRSLSNGIRLALAFRGSRAMGVDFRSDQETAIAALGQQGVQFYSVGRRFCSQAGYPDCAADVILVTSYAQVELLPMGVYGPAKGNILVVNPTQESLAEAAEVVRLLRKKAGVTQVGVVVKGVTDGAVGRQVFLNLHNVMGRFLDADFEYLGHYESDEKIFTPTMPEGGKTLIDFKSGPSSIPSVELISKRILSRYLGLEAEAGLKMGRFKDEPAQVAPGNTARFWKTLLGEVMA